MPCKDFIVNFKNFLLLHFPPQFLLLQHEISRRKISILRLSKNYYTLNVNLNSKGLNRKGRLLIKGIIRSLIELQNYFFRVFHIKFGIYCTGR